MTARWEQILDEYESVGMGPVLIDEVSQRTKAFIERRKHSYPPRLYAGVGRWDKNAVDDLIQDVQLALLDDDRQQLHWLMDHSVSLEKFRHWLTGPIKKALADRLERSVLHNLWDRCKGIVRAPPFVEVGRIGRLPVYTSGDHPVAIRPATDDELRDAALRVALIPTTRPEAGERAPTVYTTENLSIVVEAVSRSLPNGFTLRDVENVLKQVLPSWYPSHLENEVTEDKLPVARLSTADEALARTAADAFMSSLTSGEQHVLRLRLAGVSVTDMAFALDVSRPTATKRRDALDAGLRETLEDLSDSARELTLQILALEAILSEDETRLEDR